MFKLEHLRFFIQHGYIVLDDSSDVHWCLSLVLCRNARYPGVRVILFTASIDPTPSLNGPTPILLLDTDFVFFPSPMPGSLPQRLIFWQRLRFFIAYKGVCLDLSFSKECLFSASNEISILVSEPPGTSVWTFPCSRYCLFSKVYSIRRRTSCIRSEQLYPRYPNCYFLITTWLSTLCHR